MAVTLQFTFGSVCAGGNHIGVTAALAIPGDDKSFTQATQKADLFDKPRDEEVAAMCRVLLCLLRRQLPQGATNQTVKAAIEGKIIDLTIA